MENSSSPRVTLSVEESIREGLLPNESMNSRHYGYSVDQVMADKAPSESVVYPSVSTGVSATVDCSAIDTSQVLMPGRKSTEKRASRKSNKEALRRKDGVTSNSSEEASGSWNTYVTSSTVVSSKEVFKGHKVFIMASLLFLALFFYPTLVLHIINTLNCYAVKK